MVTGVNQAYLDVQGLEVDAGRNLLASDFLGGSRAAVVSESIKDELLEDGEDLEANELLGMIIYMNNQPVEIVGVQEAEDSFFDLGMNMVYVPIKTWQSVFADTSITEVSIKAEGPDELEIAGEKAADMLNQLHEKDDAYQILNMEEIADGIGKVTRIMTIIISSIAGVSLLVGGIRSEERRVGKEWGCT